MKRCPRCNLQYQDPSLNFCLDDGSPLEDTSFHTEETLVMQSPGTAVQSPLTTQQTGSGTGQPVDQRQSSPRRALPWVILILVFVIFGCGGGLAFIAYLGLQSETAQEDKTSTSPPQINIDNSSKQPPATNKSVTLAKFEAIKNGMRRAQVEEIIGSKGAETFSSEIAGMTVQSMEWKDGPLKMIIVNFQNDKVTYKMQIGLSE